MGYEKVLKLSLVPALGLSIFSFLSIIFTVVYWIIGDWVVERWIKMPSQFKEKDKIPIDDTIVYWTEPSTNATITSGCLNLAAGIMAIIAWSKLRNHEIDSDFNTPLRRFWIASVLVTGVAGVSSAIAAVATHYTDKGPDEWNCTTQTSRTTTGIPFTNLFCSREIGSCDFLKPRLKGTSKEWAADATCGMTVTVKWLQVVLALFGAAAMVMFVTQSRLRTKSRWSRHMKEPANPL